jgi:hypothetical protein
MLKGVTNDGGSFWESLFNADGIIADKMLPYCTQEFLNSTFYHEYHNKVTNEHIEKLAEYGLIVPNNRIKYKYF